MNIKCLAIFIQKTAKDDIFIGQEIVISNKKEKHWAKSNF